jgi:hypothetical protein
MKIIVPFFNRKKYPSKDFKQVWGMAVFLYGFTP